MFSQALLFQGIDITNLPFLTNRKGYNGRGIARKVVFPSRIYYRRPRITLLVHSFIRKEGRYLLVGNMNDLVTDLDLFEAGFDQMSFGRVDRMKGYQSWVNTCRPRR